VPAKLLLVGDSVAYTLHESLGQVVSARGITFAGATFPGCGMVGETPLGRDDVEPEWAHRCAPALVEAHTRVVAEFDPDLVVWLSTWESLDRRIGDEIVRFGTPGMDAWLLGALQETVDRLTAGGAEVVILTIPPEVDAAEGDAGAEWNRDLLHLNSLFRQLASRSGGRVSIADLAGIVCPRGRCEQVVDGTALRPDDGVHFSKDGARWVAERILDPVLRAAAN
jgi:hypothetical protein